MKKILGCSTLALAVAMSMPAIASKKMPSMEKMWEIIQQQQATIEKLQKENKETDIKVTATALAVKETEEKVEATASAMDSVTSTASNTSSRTTIGGYGELHYNNLEDSKTGDNKNEIDFHRFVLFFGHEFSDSLRLFSELEIEHVIAGEGQVGEVELEQAYIEKDFTENLSAKAGLFLMPVGIMNETHEPPTFYGTERNPVEKNIIPSTWWEGGLAAKGHYNSGFSFDLGFTSGLYLTADNKYAVRKGRQKVGKANADSAIFSGRVKYTGIAGLELSLTGMYQNDYNMGDTSDSESMNLIETHAIYNTGDFTIKALYANWNLDGKGADILGADKQTGWYIEPSYKVTPKIGLFARYNSWDNTAGSSLDTEITQIDVGISYWLDEDVVLKADYQNQSGYKNVDGFNLGMGYQF